jgi:hypothetical protein
MLTNFKRRSALLITLAMVCASVSVVPLTAGAAASNVPNAGTSAGVDPHTAPAAPEIMKACPGDSAPAAGFTDTTSTDVDCIKMFGITTGKTATTYDPTGTISRQDMARYIHRMFTATGLAAAGLTAVPAFTDTASVTADGLAAITALASHGITLGTTATTFSPDDNVTRAQMATFLKRFAALVKNDAGGALTANSTTGTYNYTDIANLTYEEMESVIVLFNLGALGTCVVSALGKCDGTTGGTTYRPTDNITRAEMATMVTNLLNHTNARPAGVTIQASSAGATLAVGAVTTFISVRGADHSASANVLVDEFFQVHNDATGVAAQAPFVTTLGSCTALVSKALGGTLCVVDSTDPSTDVRGNAVGTSLTTAAYSTANWWVQTGATGSTYVDGTTSTFDKLSIGFGAAATLVDAASTVISTGDIYATAENLSAYAGITMADGILTFAGQSRTITVAMKSAVATSTVKPGYSIKVVTKTQDVLGNITTSTAYYAATSAVGAATASFTTTCPADDSALTTTYATAIEHQISMGALLDADGVPTGAINPMDDDATFNGDTTTYGTGTGGATAPADTGDSGHVFVGLTCQDTTRVYTGGTTAEALSVSSNNYAIATAGSLASITATAYDQYGAGIAGASVGFRRVATNATAAGATTNTTLTTSANGTATISEVHCKTGGEISSAWSVVDPTSSTLQMDDITAAAPSLGAVEGTTIYCTSAGADGDTPLEQVATATQTTTLTFNDQQADWTGGTLTLTFTNTRGYLTDSVSTTSAMAHGLFSTIANNSGGAKAEGVIEGLASVPESNIASTTSGDGNQVLTIIFPANTGLWTVTVVQNTLTGGSLDALVIANGTPGVAAITFEFIDDDPTANFIITKHTIATASTVGAAETTTKYNTWLYDSTDFFTLDATDDDIATTVQAASEAQFEAANALHNDLATHMTMTYRKTAAVSTGVSIITVGT